MDRLVEAGRETGDPEKRMEYYDELEESGYSDEVCDKVIAELKPENLPKQYFFRTPEAVNTLSFDKVKRQVIG